MPRFQIASFGGLRLAVRARACSCASLRRYDWPLIKAVEALSKRPGETRLQAAERAACHPIACAVKLADNADNMDLSRIASPTDKDHARLAQYRAVRKLLLSAQSNHHSPA